MNTIFLSCRNRLSIALPTACVIAAMAFYSATALAQQAPQPFHKETLQLDSGQHDGNGKDFFLAWSQTVDGGNAPWIQLHFGETNLGKRSYVLITSVEDGDAQNLTAESMAVWNQSSGVFRGGSVTVDMHVAPGDSGVSIQLAGMTVGDFALPGDPDPNATQCGLFDDRVSSNDPRIGRLFFGGCTAWLIPNGTVLTAGHCFPLSGVVEFNVPQSQANGATVPAAIQNQYPITTTYQAFHDDGDGQIGRDWGVFSIGPNSQTGLRAHVTQGFIRCTNALPMGMDSAVTRIAGFGIDTSPLSSNYTQQESFGAFLGEDNDSDGIWLQYWVDTMPGNSGSPVIRHPLDVATGIHTNGGCFTVDPDFDEFNSGTSFELDELENFMNLYWGNSVEHVDVGHPPLLPADGSILRPWPLVSQGLSALPVGGVLVLVEGNYDETLTITKPMTIQAPVGTVSIGN